MAKSVGKAFEENWKKSVPKDVMYFRLKDSAQAFGGSNNLRFSIKNPCDCFLYTMPYMFALELKSVGTSSISFEKTKGEPKKVIHYHQIEGLKDFAKYNIISGFVLNFRKKDGTEICYYQHIDDFVTMIDSIDKKSFNEKDLMDNNAMIIESKKKKVNYSYNIEKFIKDTTEEILCTD